MNDAYISAMNSSIENATTCDDLQAIAGRVTAIGESLLGSIAGQLSILTDLISVPGSDPSEMAEYLSKVAAYFTGPYNSLIEQQAAVVEAIALLTSSIQEKISQLSCDF